MRWDSVLVGFLCYGIMVAALVWVLEWMRRNGGRRE